MGNILKRLQRIFDIVKPKKMVDTLFAGYVTLIIIPLLILGIIVTSIFGYLISEQAKENGIYGMENAKQILGGSIDDVYNTAYNLICDSDVLNFTQYSKFSVEQAMAISHINTILQRAENQSELIDNIYLYYRDLEGVVHSQTSVRNVKELLDTFCLTQDEFRQMLYQNNGKFMAMNVPTEYGEKNYYLFVKGIDKKGTVSDNYMIFLLNQANMKEALHLVNYENAGTAFLLDKEYRCLLQDGDKEIVYDEKTQESIQKFAAENTDGYIKGRIGGEKVYALVQDIALTGLKLCYVVERSYYTATSGIIWAIILLISLFIMLMSIFVARIYSRRIYRPIENIMEMFKPDKTQEGEKSELAFIESKFAELQRFQNEFSGYRDTHTEYMRETLICNFLKGHAGSWESLEQTLSDFDIRFTSNYYNVLLVKIDRLAEVAKEINRYHYQEFIRENIIEVLQTSIGSYTYNRFYGFYDGEYIGVIVCHNGIDEFEKIIKMMQKSIKNKLDMTVSVCIGETISEAGRLPESYSLLCETMEQMRLGGYAFVVTAEAYRTHNWDISFFDTQSRTIYSLVAGRNYEELDKVIDCMLIEKELFYAEIMQIFTEIIKILLDLIKDKECTDDAFAWLTVNPYEKIQEFHAVSEVADCLKTLCREVGDGVDAQRQNRNKSYERIMDYIHANYMQDISLQTMAEEFGFSVSYFSRFLKEVTGKNYTELLNGYRIEKAKEIMTNDPTAKLFQIAEQVGFASYRTFSTAFKKFEGQSPEAYRKNG